MWSLLCPYSAQQNETIRNRLTIVVRVESVHLSTSSKLVSTQASNKCLKKCRTPQGHEGTNFFNENISTPTVQVGEIINLGVQKAPPTYSSHSLMFSRTRSLFKSSVFFFKYLNDVSYFHAFFLLTHGHGWVLQQGTDKETIFSKAYNNYPTDWLEGSLLQTERHKSISSARSSCSSTLDASGR